jgi:hypothetical protein
MTRKLEVDQEAAEESEAQTAYYLERAGSQVALRFVAEIEAIYRGLVDRRVVGVGYPQVQFRLAVKRVFLDKFPLCGRVLSRRRPGQRRGDRSAAKATRLLALAAARTLSGTRARQCRFIARSISRLSSASRFAARLSCCFLCVTSASSTLTLGPLK